MPARAGLCISICIYRGGRQRGTRRLCRGQLVNQQYLPDEYSRDLYRPTRREGVLPDRPNFRKSACICIRSVLRFFFVRQCGGRERGRDILKGQFKFKYPAILCYLVTRGAAAAAHPAVTHRRGGAVFHLERMAA